MAGERGRSRAAGPEPDVGLEPVARPGAAPAALGVPKATEPERLTHATPGAASSIVDVPTTRRAVSSWRPGWLVAGAALLLASTALVTSSVLWRGAENQRTQASNGSAAASSARAIVEKMLGYDYKSFDQHTTEVSALLTGSFKKEFVRAATDVVKPLAVQNQAVILAKAGAVSVMSAPGQDGQDGQGSVRILAFVDQTTTSAKLTRPQIDQNRVILTMSQVDGRWLVSKVEAF